LGQGERTFKEQTIEQIPWWAQLLARKVGKLNWVMMCKQAHIGVLCTFSNHIVNAAKECVLFFYTVELGMPAAEANALEHCQRCL